MLRPVTGSIRTWRIALGEVVDAIDALADRHDLDVDDLGIIGVSQGGWVIPLVADRIDVDFFVAWSTAIDWVEQGEYLTERLLANADASPELADRVRRADRADRGDTFQDYLDWHDRSTTTSPTSSRR